MATTTAGLIRDRVITITEYIDPVSLTSTRLRKYRNEGGADFREWAEGNPAGAFRRFQWRDVGEERFGDVSNLDFDARTLTLEGVFAYPQSHRYGGDNALDRDDVLNQDWTEIDYNVGICGRGNFGSTYDCTPLGCTKEIEIGDAIDFLVVRAEFRFYKALSANGGLVSSLGLGLGG